jgi:hypothetical protein
MQISDDTVVEDCYYHGMATVFREVVVTYKIPQKSVIY